MRIAYFCLEAQQSRFHTSGYAVHLNAMIEAFRRAGHEVGVVVLGEWLGRGQAREDVSIRSRRGLKGVAKRVVPGVLWETAKDVRVFWYDRRFRRRYRDLLRGFKPDVMYEQVAFLAASGARLAGEFGIPLMAELHAPMVEERTRDGRRSLISSYATKLEIRNLSAADCIRVVSSPLKRHLVKRGIAEGRILVQPNGTDTARFTPDAGDGHSICQRLDLTDKVVFGFAGSFFKWHRIDVLLKGLARIRSGCPNAALLIVGDGEGSLELRQLASDHGIADVTHFAGNVPHHEMKDYYAAMDICCMPGTNWYGSPLKLMEYGAMQRPIIAPDTESVRDFMEPDADCVMVRQGDVDAMARAMKALYGDAGLRDRLAQRFHEKVCSQYTWDQVAGNILARLEGLAADQRTVCDESSAGR